MKKNMIATMNRLDIDGPIRPFIRQLWKHGYRTSNSCDGKEKNSAYVMFREGDGWLGENALRYGLKKRENSSCCSKFERGGSMWLLDVLSGHSDVRSCGDCGAGVNGHEIYRRPTIL